METRDELWSNEKVEVRPAIIAEHSRWAASRGRGGGGGLSMRHESTPVTAIYHRPHSSVLSTLIPPSTLIIHFTLQLFTPSPFIVTLIFCPISPREFITTPPFIYEFYKSIVFHRVFAVARLLRNSSNWRSMVLEIERGDVYFNAILLLFERISHCPLSRVYAIGESLFVKLIKQSLSGFIE